MIASGWNAPDTKPTPGAFCIVRVRYACAQTGDERIRYIGDAWVDLSGRWQSGAEPIEWAHDWGPECGVQRVTHWTLVNDEEQAGLARKKKPAAT